MYYGSNYCPGCKYNRDCFMMSNRQYGYGNNRESNCIILKNIFEKEYRKENGLEVNNNEAN